MNTITNTIEFIKQNSGGGAQTGDFTFIFIVITLLCCLAAAIFSAIYTKTYKQQNAFNLNNIATCIKNSISLKILSAIFVSMIVMLIMSISFAFSTIAHADSNFNATNAKVIVAEDGKVSTEGFEIQNNTADQVISINSISLQSTDASANDATITLYSEDDTVFSGKAGGTESLSQGIIIKNNSSAKFTFDININGHDALNLVDKSPLNFIFNYSNLITSCDIIYKDQGGLELSGELDSDTPTIHNFGETTQLKWCYKYNYNFEGWHRDADCAGDAVTEIPADEIITSNSITLYAKWSEITTFTITLDDNGGSGGSGKIFADKQKGFFKDSEYTQKIDNVNIPTKTSNEFLGYYVQTDSGEKQLTDKNGKFVAGPEIYDDIYAHTYAKWDANVNRINIIDDKTCINTIYEKYGEGYYADEAARQSIISIVPPTKENHTFNGVFTRQNKEGNLVINNEGKIVASNKMFTEKEYSIYVDWISNVCKIEVKVSGTEAQTVYQKYGEGYYSDPECTISIDKVTPAEEVTGKLFAGYYFSKDDHEYIFADANGKIVADNKLFTQENANVDPKDVNGDDGNKIITCDLNGLATMPESETPTNWQQLADNIYAKAYPENQTVSDALNEWNDTKFAGIDKLAWSDTPEKLTDNILVKNNSSFKDKLGNYEWPELKTIANDISAKYSNTDLSTSAYYNTMKDFAKNGQYKKVGEGDEALYVRIIDINHDVKKEISFDEKEYAGLTFMPTNSIKNLRQYNNKDNEDYNYNWENSSLRKSMNNEDGEIYNFMMTNIDPDKKLVEKVDKKYATAWAGSDASEASEFYQTSINTCQDMFFLPSFKEITGLAGEDSTSYGKALIRGDEGEKYQFIANDVWHKITNWDSILDDDTEFKTGKPSWWYFKGPVLNCLYPKSFTTMLDLYWLFDTSTYALSYCYDNIEKPSLTTGIDNFHSNWERSADPATFNCVGLYKYNGCATANAMADQYAAVAPCFCL